MIDSFGYHGDGFEEGGEARAHVPSLERDGDPFFHAPINPVAERHGDWQVYNPGKEAVDMGALGDTVEAHYAETTSFDNSGLTAAEQAVLEGLEAEFDQ